MNRIALGLGASALLGFGSCAEAPTTTGDDFGYKGTGIAFGVSPLTLDALVDACYSFSVENASDALVVGRGPNAAANFGAVTGTAARTICASQFGNSGGGDISYVAPCDASISPFDERIHTVTLWVDALCTAAVTDKAAAPELLGGPADAICPEMQDYVNPCGLAGCALDVTCVENADTPVTFNFTIMGQADQGFFDLAVNFDDVFCSAKLDDCNTLNQPIQLMFDTAETVLAVGGCPWGTGLAYGTLTAEQNTQDFTQGTNPDGCDQSGNPHVMAGVGDVPFAQPGPLDANPNFGQRIDTMVAAVACTAGPGDDVTTHLTFTELRVSCQTPAVQQATLTLTSVTQEGNLMIGPFPSAVYFGTESLPDVNKVFTTVAIGIGERTGCTFEWQVIPSNGPQDFGRPDEYNSFGYVNFEANGVGAGCSQNALNDGSSAVTTMYYPATPIQPSEFNSQLQEGTAAFATWVYVCYNVSQQITTLAAEVAVVESALTQLEADVVASTNPSGDPDLVSEFYALQFQAAIRRNAYLARIVCEGFDAELASIDADLTDIESRLATLETTLVP